MKIKVIITIQLILVGSFNILITSCAWNKSVDDGYYFEDFDNLKMWDNSSQVTNECSHSGKYCTYTDDAHPFSQIFEMDLSPETKKYKSIQVTAWCRKTNKDSKVKLVASFESHGQTLQQQALNFADALELENTWINLVLFLKFPEQIPDGSKVKVYAFSPEKEKAFVDDVRIEFRKR
jgi:hypothetical protein